MISVHSVCSLSLFIRIYHKCHTSLVKELASMCCFVGLLLCSWVRWQEMFLNSAEQLFENMCWTSFLLFSGLQPIPPPSSKTYIHTISAHPIRSKKCGWLPAWRHCVPLSLLPPRDADQNNKPGCSCCGTSAGLYSLITFCTPPTFSHCSYESRDDVVLATCGICLSQFIKCSTTTHLGLII